MWCLVDFRNSIKLNSPSFLLGIGGKTERLKDSPSYGVFLARSNHVSRKITVEVVSKNDRKKWLRRFRFSKNNKKHETERIGTAASIIVKEPNHSHSSQSSITSSCFSFLFSKSSLFAFVKETIPFHRTTLLLLKHHSLRY